MGTILRADCACGLEASVEAGGGRADGGARCRAPAACGGCRQVVSVTIVSGSGQGVSAPVAEPPGCGTCGSLVEVYGEVVGDPDDVRRETAAADWTLPDGSAYLVALGPHRCPACASRSLLLTPAGVWD